MRYHHRIFHYAPICIIGFVISIASGCFHSNNSNGGGGNNASLNDFTPHTALILDNQTGRLAAGSVVPMACISGGNRALPDACSDVHLHGTINISGIGSGFSDPAQTVCGHGKLSIVFEKFLTVRCPELDDAKLSVIVDDLSSFSEAFLTLIEPDGSKLITDFRPTLFEGFNPAINTLGNTFEKAEVMTTCVRGINSATGNTEIEHRKSIVDLTSGDQVRLQLKCTPFINIVTANLDVNLANTDIIDGEFYTGNSRKIPPLMLSPGFNALSFDAETTESTKNGLVIAGSIQTPYLKGGLFNFDPQTNDSIDADSTTLKPYQQTPIDDSIYLGGDYQGLDAYVKARGLRANYFSLDGTTTTGRTVPTTDMLSNGGIYEFKSRFMATEPVTMRMQTANIARYRITPGTTAVTFTEPQPPYITENDFSTNDDPAAQGFDLNLTYNIGSSKFLPVKLGLRAETFDGATSTMHSWIVNNFTDDITMTDASWPPAYISATMTAGLLPTGSNLMKIKFLASDNQVAMRKQQQSPDIPMDNLNNVVSIRVSYDF